MPKFNVMIISQEQQALLDTNPKHDVVGVVHCQLEAMNEMLAQKYLRDGIFDRKYPKKSWIEPE